MRFIEALIENSESQAHRLMLKDESMALTYRQGMQLIRALSHQLVQTPSFAEDGRPVVILQRGALHSVISMCACLYAGIPYVPLSCHDPRQRIDAIIKQVRPRLVLGRRADVAEYEELALEVDLSSLDATEIPYADATHMKNSKLAYVIFTSGTTGVPKGVSIKRSSFDNAVFDALDHMAFDKDTYSYSVLPLHFDGSYSGVFSVLAAGGAIYLNDRQYLIPHEFYKVMSRERISHTAMTPTYLRLLLQAVPANAAGLREHWKSLGIGGEEVVKDLLVEFFAKFPDVSVYNRYGPTETTMAVATFRVTRDIIDNYARIPIGKPGAGTTFYILNERNEPVENDLPGELYVAGEQVMDGYFDDPELTKSVLVGCGVHNEPAFRTGDMVVIGTDGNLTYVGRIANLLKRGGVRFSLEEIEEALRKCQFVTFVKCKALEETPVKIEAEICVSKKVALEDIRSELRTKLPISMIPDRITIVDKISLSSSGKAASQSR